jgi:hypothetical protein
MHKLLVVILVVGLACGVACAQPDWGTATQTVNFVIPEINALTVSGDPGTLTIVAPTAGNLPEVVSDATTSYALTTNDQYGAIITASLDQAMPTGAVLTVNLTAPTGATSNGDVTLSAVPHTVVHGLSQIASSGNTITYKLDASALPVPANSSRTVTFTLSGDV